MSQAKSAAKSLWYSVFTESPYWYVTQYLKGVGTRAYRRKADEVSSYRQWVKEVGDGRVRRHWARADVTEQFALEQLKSQIFEITQVISDRLASAESHETVLDAGASDGLFLSSLPAKRCVGLNILHSCARSIQRDGYRACCGDLERLPFASKSFDYVVCCETLEHLPNPIRGLQELERICRRRIHLTIPWLPGGRTRINPRYTEHVDDQHIFEFGAADFEVVVSHANLRIAHSGLIEVFPESRVGLITRLLMRRFIYPSFFPKLQYYELTPRTRNEQALP